MTVLIVGDEPSKLNKDPDVAFVGARCCPRLQEWIKILELGQYTLINSNTEDDMNYILTFSAATDWPIIALGRKAQRRLRSHGIAHIPLPHPSGRNRQLNDPALIFTELVIAKLLLGKPVELKDNK